MLDVIVTWMDGKLEIYPCGKYEVSDGVLSLWTVKYKMPLKLHDDPEWNIPLRNIRIYRIEPHRD